MVTGLVRAKFRCADSATNAGGASGRGDKLVVTEEIRTDAIGRHYPLFFPRRGVANRWRKALLLSCLSSLWRGGEVGRIDGGRRGPLLAFPRLWRGGEVAVRSQHRWQRRQGWLQQRSELAQHRERDADLRLGGCFSGDCSRCHDEHCRIC